MIRCLGRSTFFFTSIFGRLLLLLEAKMRADCSRHKADLPMLLLVLVQDTAQIQSVPENKDIHFGAEVSISLF